MEAMESGLRMGVGMGERRSRRRRSDIPRRELEEREYDEGRKKDRRKRVSAAVTRWGGCRGGAW